jgi:hypothetical protein
LSLTPQEKIALIVLVDLFINAARTGHGVTYNEVFDEVCRKFSDHFVASPASRSRDMRPITVKNARRDLLCNYIDINKLWTLFRGMQMRGDSFFSVAQDHTSDPSAPLQVTLIQGPGVEEFIRLVGATPKYLSSRNHGVRLSFVDDEDAPKHATKSPSPKSFARKHPTTGRSWVPGRARRSSSNLRQRYSSMWIPFRPTSPKRRNWKGNCVRRS